MGRETRKRIKGRPATKKPLRSFKLLPKADSALDSMSARFGWTATATVERALLFASSHKEFGVPQEFKGVA